MWKSCCASLMTRHVRRRPTEVILAPPNKGIEQNARRQTAEVRVMRVWSCATRSADASGVVRQQG